MNSDSQLFSIGIIVNDDDRDVEAISKSHNQHHFLKDINIQKILTRSAHSNQTRLYFYFNKELSDVQKEDLQKILLNDEIKKNTNLKVVFTYTPENKINVLQIYCDNKKGNPSIEITSRDEVLHEVVSLICCKINSPCIQRDHLPLHR
jgi:hypothetical protein